MHFSTTTILYILLSVGPSALAGPIAPKPTDLSRSGGSGPDGHCLSNTGSEQAQTQGVAVQPDSINVTLSGKKGGGGAGGGGHGGGHSGGHPKVGGSASHGHSAASSLECEFGAALFIWCIALLA